MKMDPKKKKEIFGWVMYDFANSAFATTILAAVLPIYFASIVPANGVPIHLFGLKFTTAASSLWAYTVSLSMLLVAFSAPVLGSIADFSNSKKRFLFVYCYLGCLFTGLLFFVQTGDYWMAMVFFALGNIGFAGGNVFYNAFLRHITTEKEIDWVSGKGFAYGYLGGGLLLVINLVMITKYQWFGFSTKAMGTRASFATVGLWWAVFAIPIFLFVRERRNSVTLPDGKNYVSLGFSTLFKTLRKIGDFKEMVKFLIAFLIYNDGVQTVIAMATIYGATELKL
ncbi:MFS transporter, partial [candidate division KSB1 bacterium]|nr:MFS transporter [candidate division KSB1 bacterium]